MSKSKLGDGCLLCKPRKHSHDCSVLLKRLSFNNRWTVRITLTTTHTICNSFVALYLKIIIRKSDIKPSYVKIQSFNPNAVLSQFSSIAGHNFFKWWHIQLFHSCYEVPATNNSVFTITVLLGKILLNGQSLSNGPYTYYLTHFLLFQAPLSTM